MKNTFLMNKIHEDGGAALCVVTAEEWLDAVKENRSLPPEQRRYPLHRIQDGRRFIWKERKSQAKNALINPAV